MLPHWLKYSDLFTRHRRFVAYVITLPFLTYGTCISLVLIVDASQPFSIHLVPRSLEEDVSREGVRWCS